MKVSFDVQSLFEEKKTGTGITVENILKHMAISGQDEYQMNCFAFKNGNRAREILAPYENKGYHVKLCNYFPKSIFDRCSLPYSMFMGKDSDITQFFSHKIPPGVKGKKVIYIYDMVYRACPETMENNNRLSFEREVEENCKRADFIITISEFSKREIIKYLGVEAERIFVVPCGVDLSVFKTDVDVDYVDAVKMKYGINGSYFLYMGTLEPRKNIPLILTAYWNLKKESNKNLPSLVIAGKKGWGYKTIFGKVQEYGLDRDVVFTDYIEEKEKWVLLKGALCFLFPSIYEGFGLPPLEAMACGTPVIVSTQASLPEVVGEAGLFVDPNDDGLLSEYMRKIWHSEDYRCMLSAQGKKRAIDYSWDSATVRLKGIYEKIKSI